MSKIIYFDLINKLLYVHFLHYVQFLNSFYTIFIFPDFKTGNSIQKSRCSIIIYISFIQFIRRKFYALTFKEISLTVRCLEES